MSDHLPECLSANPSLRKAEAPMYGLLCICDELRACEQRVRHEGLGVCIQHYDAGVQAAREAVAALLMDEDPFNISVYDALDAIDALKEKPDMTINANCHYCGEPTARGGAHTNCIPTNDAPKTTVNNSITVPVQIRVSLASEDGATVGADGFGRGYNRGYFAALEAVEQAIRDALSDDGRNLYAELTSLAAIDALREVEK